MYISFALIASEKEQIYFSLPYLFWWNSRAGWVFKMYWQTAIQEKGQLKIQILEKVMRNHSLISVGRGNTSSADGEKAGRNHDCPSSEEK